MVAKKFEFQGKDVAEAIQNACRILNAAQEDLDIEVLNTGSLGIFGLCSRKVRLRVSVKHSGAAPQVEESADVESVSPASLSEEVIQSATVDQGEVTEEKAQEPKPVEESTGSVQAAPAPSTNSRPVVEITAETCEAVREELGKVLELMELPSAITVKAEQNAVAVHIDGDHVDTITAEDGKVLDGLQYLLRKMLSKQRSENVAIVLDAGDYRANRLKNLEGMALKFAEEVKANGRTKSIPSLNPSERRVVHVTLQEDKEIRSRSVGDGLFKKVLIYKPGKGRKGGGGRGRGRGRGSGGSGGENKKSADNAE